MTDTQAGFDASAKALDSLTTKAENHPGFPRTDLFRAADHESSHSWISRTISASAVDSLEARFKMGNYVIDRKTGEKSFEAMSLYVRLGMHLLYYGSEQEKALQWQSTVKLLKDQSVKMGKEYDTLKSRGHIEPFIKSFNLEDTLSEMVQPDPTKYATFNEFFAREIKESARPIDDPENDLVSSSPADCRLTAFPTIDLAVKYWIKGFGFTLEKLLGDADLAQQFDGGSIVIARLAPQDYHRWHAPVAGVVQGVKAIPGAYYTVNPQAINEPGTLDVFCENKRSVMTVQRSNTGSPIAIIAVGAMLVGSIEYVGGVEKPGSEIRRGQCLGKFLYGGSTVIVVYPKGEIALDGDLVKNSMEEDCETLMRVGWRVGEKKCRRE